LPFVTSAYDAEGVVRIGTSDAVNTTLTLSWTYHTAARGNPEHRGGPLLFDRLLKSPPAYAIAVSTGQTARSRCSLPVSLVGFNTVTFASLERLDMRLATNALSLSMIGSFVLSFLVTVASA
jgi:predicted permease